MNQNHEKKKTQKDGKAEPALKKVAKFSAFIYLGLAITVVVVATVGIFSMSYDYETQLNSVSIPQIGNDSEDISIPQISITPNNPNDDEESSLPVINEPDDVPADVIEPDETPDEKPTEDPILFYTPVEGEIQKDYSMDVLVYSETMGDYRVHSGIDISAPLGTPVLCFTDGVVESIEEDYFYGMMVTVSHENNLVSYYMNLDPVLAQGIAVGKTVKAGQTLGKVGSSARCEACDAPHLHLEMRVNGVLVNPVSQLG